MAEKGERASTGSIQQQKGPERDQQVPSSKWVPEKACGAGDNGVGSKTNKLSQAVGLTDRYQDVGCYSGS